MTFLRVLFLALALAAPAHAKDRTFQHPMSDGAATSGITFSGGGVIAIAAMIIEVQGRVAVCGFWAETERLGGTVKSSGILRRGLGGASVQYGNRALVRGLRFFPQVPLEDFKTGTPATCKLTNRKWRPGLSNKGLRITITRQTVVG